jgi:hypothetical protein
MRIVALLLAAGVALSACTSQFEPIAPSTGYSQIGATVKSPNEPGWALGYARPNGIALGKKSASGPSTIILTNVSQLTGSGSNEQFFDRVLAIRSQDNNPARFAITSEKNTPVSFKNAACIKTELTALDRKASATAPHYLKNTGYICRHPANMNVAFLMELSVRSTEKTLSQSDLAVAHAFFADVTFTNDGL